MALDHKSWSTHQITVGTYASTYKMVILVDVNSSKNQLGTQIDPSVLTSSALITALNLVTGESNKGSHRNFPNSAESSAGSRFGRASVREHTNPAMEPNFRLVAVRLPLE